MKLQPSAKLLQAVGRHVVDYFYTTRDCLICFVDKGKTSGNGDPMHQPWCPVGPVVAGGSDVPLKRFRSRP